jgi:hypothetical protein
MRDDGVNLKEGGNWRSRGEEIIFLYMYKHYCIFMCSVTRHWFGLVIGLNILEERNFGFRHRRVKIK